MQTEKPIRSLAVTLLGGFTFLAGAAHAILGGFLIFAGEKVMNSPEVASDKPYGFLGQFIGVLLLVVGIVLVLEGLFELLAATGALFRKRWGQVLMVFVALISGAWGVLYLSVAGGDEKAIGYGLAHLVYSLVTICVLIGWNADFSQPVSRVRDLARSEYEEPAASGTTDRSPGR